MSLGTDWRTWSSGPLALTANGWDPTSGMRAIPSAGTVRVPVVLIDFTDQPATVTPDALDSMINGPGDPALYPQESLAGFYDRSSYGKLHIQGDILGVYHAPYPRSSVNTKTTQSEMDIIEEALRYFDEQGTDFSVYDADHDGDIDYTIAIWSGPRGEWSSFWWGWYRPGMRSTGTFDGKYVGAHSWQWEPPGGSVATVIHETGHALGLPDVYDYDKTVGPGGGVGAWDQMESGDCDHNAFSKLLLGWLTPKVVSDGTQALTLRPTSEAPDAAIVMPDYSLDDPFRELFLIQTRARTLNDSSAPFPTTPALMVWHIDPLIDYDGTFRWNNSYTSHKFLRLMEADGLEHLEAGGAADSADLLRPARPSDRPLRPPARRT